MMRVERPIHFQREVDGRKRIVREPVKVKPVEPGSVPRVSRLMALAIQFERMLQDGDARDQSSLAQIVNVTQPRMTQILNLLHLAPDIQETILFLPRTVKGDDPIHEKMLRPLTAEISWKTQRIMWQKIQPFQLADHEE